MHLTMLEGNLAHVRFVFLQCCCWKYALAYARSKFSVCLIYLTLQCCYVLMCVLEGNLARARFVSSYNVLVLCCKEI